MRPKDRDADKQEKKCKPERGGPRRPATLRSAMTAPTISAIAFDRRAPSGHVRLTSTPAVSCSAVLPSSLAIEPCVRRTCVLALTSRDFSPHLVGWLVLAEADVNSVA
jgi:hypothetical protein